jgi:MYXO-CTERM domain-containing protein
MRFLTTFRVFAPLAAVLLAGPVRAEQFVLFDINYTHTAANDSHYSVSGATLKQPDNWTSPIDYANGTIHFYQEVETKPSALVTIIDFCFISSGYGCIETLPYTTTGVHETMRSMAPGGDWYQRNQINFTRKMSSIQMVLKDPATYTNGCPKKADCLPSKMRFVATLVSPGGTYVKPTPSPGVTPPDGGAAPTPTADAATAEPDAGAPAAADAAEPVDPPVKADAAAADPKPVKADAAASKPPTMTDPPDDPDPAPAARKSGGCTVGGTASGGLGVLGLLLLVTLRRRRR